MEIKFAEDTSKYDDYLCQAMIYPTADGSTNTLSVGPCEPEDAIIGRDLIGCDQIIDLMKLAYEAGKRGEEFIVRTVDWEEI